MWSPLEKLGVSRRISGCGLLWRSWVFLGESPDCYKIRLYSLKCQATVPIWEGFVSSKWKSVLKESSRQRAVGCCPSGPSFSYLVHFQWKEGAYTKKTDRFFLLQSFPRSESFPDVQMFKWIFHDYVSTTQTDRLFIMYVLRTPSCGIKESCLK